MCQRRRSGEAGCLAFTISLDDANLHQFVTSKTNKAAMFSYFSFATEGKEIGVLWIPTQPKPIYIKNDYGRLKAATVYLRDGSSTRIASPDEIAAMGRTVSERQAVDDLWIMAQKTVTAIVEQWRRHPSRFGASGQQCRRPTYAESRDFIIDRSRRLDDYESGVDSYGSLYHVFRELEDLAARCGQVSQMMDSIPMEHRAMIDVEDYVKREQLVWQEFRDRTNHPNSPLPAEAGYNLLAIAGVVVHLVELLNSGNLLGDSEYEVRRRLTPVVVWRSENWGDW